MANLYHIYFMDTNLRIREGKVYLIGRSVRSDIALPHGSVSRKHAAIEWMGDSFLLRDLQSTNGTFVNTKRITVHTLQTDDKIQVGDFELRYEVEEDEEMEGIDGTMPLMQTMMITNPAEKSGDSDDNESPTSIINRSQRTIRITEKPGKDKLTGCFNRAYFERVIGDEVQISREFEQQMALILLDVDGFAKINEEKGREVGDDVLCVVAGVVNNVARPNDIVARYDDDQFVVIAPNATPNAAQELAEQIRVQVIERTKKTGADTTVSVGVANFTEENDTGKKLVKAAEGALATAKENGRNRVETNA